ncbi:hypothetical protein ACTXGL_09645 [Psychrobacter sp. T6-6]|uniref:hypothetical protein n=1 Tax=Psychrobacter sp. T6-6 TaxID=3457452 RepID=UPI003FD0439C
MSRHDFTPLAIYQGQPQDLQSALLEDAFTMVEHGKMSLPEALKLGLSFIKLYRDSPSFERVSKTIENERIYKAGVIDRLNAVVTTNSARR